MCANALHSQSDVLSVSPKCTTNESFGMDLAMTELVQFRLMFILSNELNTRAIAFVVSIEGRRQCGKYPGGSHL
jgi:hypothetical protein